MSPEQRQEWEDDEDALRRETAEAHTPAPESTESDPDAQWWDVDHNRPADAYTPPERAYCQRCGMGRLLHGESCAPARPLRGLRARRADNTARLALELAEAKREIARLHRDALAEAQAYRAMFARAQEAEAALGIDARGLSRAERLEGLMRGYRADLFRTEDRLERMVVIARRRGAEREP